MKSFTDCARALLLFVVLVGFGLITSAKAMAGDSGLYFDKDNLGVGLTLIRQEQTVFFNVFTYVNSGEYCGTITPPAVSIADDEGCSYNQWFFGADKIDNNDQIVTGFLYIGVGLNFPEGVPSTNNPFVQVLGENLVVGFYQLERLNNTAGGWRLAVIRVGETLPEDDPIFGVTDFPQRLVDVTD